MLNKGQEEIVGFVAIVVLVAIVGVIFLGIFLRSGGEDFTKDSVTAYQFLESLMEHSTECKIIENGNPLNVQRLLSECYSTNNNCFEKESSCKELNKTLMEILEKSWVVDEKSVIKGYGLSSIYFGDSDEILEEIVEIKEGTCGQNIVGNSYVSPEFPGRIVTTLKICY
jgi:hypothetical protein